MSYGTKRTPTNTRRICAFDLDKTLLRVNSSYRFGTYLYRRGEFSTFTMAFLVSLFFLYQMRLISMKSLHKRVFSRLFRGRQRSDFVLHAEAFLDEQFHDLLNPQAVSKLKEAQKRLDLVLILSNSPDFLVSACARRFGVLVSKGSSYEVDKDGNFLKISGLIMGNEKANLLNHAARRYQLPKEALAAYSDSFDDLPFLEAAGMPVGVNPDTKLKKICKERKWHIL